MGRETSQSDAIVRSERRPKSQRICLVEDPEGSEAICVTLDHRGLAGGGEVGVVRGCTYVATMIAFGVVWPAATAWSASNADCATDAVRAIPKVNSPVTLHDSFLAFRGCDDGAVSELFTEAVTHLLALQWDSVSQMQSLTATDFEFKEFVLRHIDAKTPVETLRRIAFNAQHYCPDRSQSFCAELRQAAEGVLRALPTASGRWWRMEGRVNDLNGLES